MSAPYNDNHLKRSKTRASRLKHVNRRLRDKLGEYRKLTYAFGIGVLMLGFTLAIVTIYEPVDFVAIGVGQAGITSRQEMADSVRTADSLQVVDSLRIVDSLEAVAEEAARSKAVGGGEASYYGNEFAGNKTASGETFNPNELTAAHRTLPFGSRVKVTNVRTGKAVVVRINDRGPYAHGRVIDLSTAAARQIGLLASGTGMVRLELLHQT